MRQVIKTSSFFKQINNFGVWSKVPASPLDPILGVSQLFKADKNPKKQLLGVGAYRDDDGKPWILNSVQKATDILHKQNLDHEYLPIDGDQEFLQLSTTLAYGAEQPNVKANTVAGIQTLSGCGGVRIGLDLIKKQLPTATICTPNPSWPIHKQIVQELGLNLKEYSYYCPKTLGLDFNNMMKDLESVQDGSVVILHACSHNPTGVDPSQQQWQLMKDMFKQKKHIAFFDMAYQGFTTGDILKDAYALRLFTEKGDIPTMLTQSYAKNMGLYGERIGAFTALCDNATETENVNGQLKGLARRMYSNPPINGSRIVKTILKNPELYKIWLQTMADRISNMRKTLKEKLLSHGSKKNWDHITNQIGMFAFTGLNEKQVDLLREQYSIYMTKDGRISIAGLNSKNIDYVAQAFHDVTK